MIACAVRIVGRGAVVQGDGEVIKAVASPLSCQESVSWSLCVAQRVYCVCGLPASEAPRPGFIHQQPFLSVWGHCRRIRDLWQCPALRRPAPNCAR